MLCHFASSMPRVQMRKKQKETDASGDEKKDGDDDDNDKKPPSPLRDDSPAHNFEPTSGPPG